jgi:hypothetical protein
VPPPWLVKPRSQAGSIGITRAGSRDELFAIVERLGDERASHLVERLVPGDIYHVDSLVCGGEERFARASRYGRPPLEVYVQGDVFSSRLLPRDDAFAGELLALDRDVHRALGFTRGVSHSEYIHGRDDGRIYFLETAARVAGAYLPDMIEAATGLNLWAEWARLELAGTGDEHLLGPLRDDHAGIAIALARSERPDTTVFAEPEIVWRLDEAHHVGFIVRAPTPARRDEVLTSVVERIRRDFLAHHP